ncbi:(2Fe-2S)-binding protein [Streptomyces sp. NPDC026672]|uniref:(2Fe-2S)-binding protein n=1 Tax=unclassified Streptomyces TaxID=2593676 RepID=UPI0033DBB2B5
MDLDPDLAALRALGGFFVLRTGGAPVPHTAPAPQTTFAPNPAFAPDATAVPHTAPVPHTTVVPRTTAAPAGSRDALPPMPPPAFAEVYGHHPAPDVPDTSLTLRVETVGRRLRTTEPRVAASVAQQALAARLWSVALGCAAIYGGVPDLDPRLLRWDASAATPDDLWLTEVRPLPGDAATLADIVLHAHLEPLGRLLHERHGVAPGLLRGNAASALAAAAGELARRTGGDGREDVARRARVLTADLFTHPLLAGTGTFTGSVFRRRSCCLYYRVPGGGVCGDCCFTRPPRSSPRAASG